MIYSPREAKPEEFEVALADLFELPVFYDGPADEDRAAGLVRVVVDGKPYVTEGHVTVEVENRWVGCVWLEGGVYESPDGYRQPRPVEVHDESGWEDSGDEAVAAAVRWQRDMAEQTGLLFPIWKR